MQQIAFVLFLKFYNFTNLEKKSKRFSYYTDTFK